MICFFQVISYSAAVKACEENWFWEEALGFLKEMLSTLTLGCFKTMKRFGAMWRWACSLEVWSSIIKPCSILQEFVAWFSDSVARIAPNLITMNSAIAACDKAGQWQVALVLWLGFTQLRSWALVTPTHRPRCHICTRTCYSINIACITLHYIDWTRLD